MNPLDLVGQQFGLLRVRAVAMHCKPRSWLCLCACGAYTVVPTGRLRSGNTQSCGCRKRAVLGISTTKHGKAGTRTHRIWKLMRSRCYCPSARGYANYGGRGIRVCRRWDKFENFLADMGECPPGLTLERSNNDGNYKPSNCLWATRATQSRNTRRNVKGRYAGKLWCMADLADACGVGRSVAWSRLQRGWSFADACTAPVRKMVRKESL